MAAPVINGRSGSSNDRCGNQIVYLPGSLLKPCAICGAPFRPEQPWHALCRQCWTFDRIGRACALFNARAAR